MLSYPSNDAGKQVIHQSHTWCQCTPYQSTLPFFDRIRRLSVSHYALRCRNSTLQTEKKSMTFPDKFHAMCRTNAHSLIWTFREHHVRKMNYSTTKVQVSYFAELPQSNFPDNTNSLTVSRFLPDPSRISRHFKVSGNSRIVLTLKTLIRYQKSKSVTFLCKRSAHFKLQPHFLFHLMNQRTPLPWKCPSGQHRRRWIFSTNEQ